LYEDQLADTIGFCPEVLGKSLEVSVAGAATDFADRQLTEWDRNAAC